MELINGGVYKQNQFRTFVLVYFCGDIDGSYDKWGMLHIERNANVGMSAPLFQHDKKGKFRFTKEELKKDWHSDEWILLDGRLRVEKIDDINMVEYSNARLDKANPPEET